MLCSAGAALTHKDFLGHSSGLESHGIVPTEGVVRHRISSCCDLSVFSRLDAAEVDIFPAEQVVGPMILRELEASCGMNPAQTVAESPL
jgi:hypothetical protein